MQRYIERREPTPRVLASLTPREERMLRVRFGIGMNTGHTSEEVGRQFRRRANASARSRPRRCEAEAPPQEPKAAAAELLG
jgi:RNA polymerase primary sigma factor